jgi:von Willebrand factor type A domain/Aerotolerance regulator N-terminal
MANKPFIFQHLWFPACLLALVLLAIPGFILFLLHIFGGDSELNQWLEEDFQLSYHFPLHWSLALVLLLIPPLILLLYFLRLKRKPLQVPSTFLWRKSIEDLHVNSLFQWLRDNVLLLLQILTVLALIYAVMGFRFHGSTSKGKHYILIVDNSASMAARDVKPSRLEWAKREALKVIDATTDDSVGMVIAFNSKAVTLQGYTTDRAKLRDAVQAIEQTSCTTRIDDALSLADSLANQIRSTEDQSSQPEGPIEPGKERQYVTPKGIPTEVYLFSDGAFPELAESSLSKLNSLLAGNTSTLGNLQLHFQLAGVPGPENVNNVGILAFNVVRHGQDNPKNKDANALKMQAFVQVRNYRPSDCEVKVVLDVETDGNVIPCGQETLALPRRTVVRQKTDKEKLTRDEPGDAQAIFDLPQLDLRSSTILKVYLKDVEDDFALDDVAWLVVGMVRKAKVLIVTPGNVVLDAFFRQDAMQKVAAVTTLTPAELTKDAYLNAAHSGQLDLVIFDRCAPEKEEDMPAANTTFIDRPPPPWERGTKSLKNPYLVVSKKDHPLLRQLTTLWDVGVSEAFRFHPAENLSTAGKAAYFDAQQKATKPLPGLTKLLETTGDQPVMFTLSRGSFTDLVMTFPLIDDKGGLATNWPLQLSFPLFMRNVLYVLGNVIEADRERTVQPGEPMLLRPEADIKALTIAPPKGPPAKLERGNRPEFIFAGTDQLGVYKVVRDDGVVRHFAVNLLDANESNIEPRTDIKIGSDEVAAGEERRQPRELWKWLALAALGLLLVEWYVYNRRIYV